MINVHGIYFCNKSCPPNIFLNPPDWLAVQCPHTLGEFKKTNGMKFQPHSLRYNCEFSFGALEHQWSIKSFPTYICSRFGQQASISVAEIWKIHSTIYSLDCVKCWISNFWRHVYLKRNKKRKLTWSNWLQWFEQIQVLIYLFQLQ